MKNVQEQLSLWDTSEVLEFQWQTREIMPNEISFFLEYPDQQLFASVDPLCVRMDRSPYAYTYVVARHNEDGSTTRIKHWLEVGKKHKVSLEEGKRICEEAVKKYLNNCSV